MKVKKRIFLTWGFGFALSLLLVGFGLSAADSLQKGIKNVEIKTKSGDLRISIGDTFYIKSGEMERTVKDSALKLSGTSEDCEMVIPDVEEISIFSVSGDINLRGIHVSGVSKVKIETVSGDIDIVDFVPGSVSIRTVSGDVYLKGEPKGDVGLWRQSSYNVVSVSGDLSLDGILYCPLTMNAISGDIDITVSKDKVPASLAPITYSLRSVSGEVSETVEGRTLNKTTKRGKKEFIYDYGDIRIEQSIRKKISLNLASTCENTRDKDYYALRPTIDGPFGYNRVDGLILGLNPTFGKKSGNYVRFGITRAFKRHAWQEWLEIQGRLKNKPGVFLLGEAFNATATYDKWIMGGMENNIAAILFKEDFRDYFLRKGVSVGFGLSPTDNLRMDIEYEDADLEADSVNAHWSIFGRRKKFRENPGFRNGHLSAFDFTFHWSFPYGDFVLNHIRSRGNSDFDVKRTFALLKIEKDFDVHNLLGRLVLGDSPDTAFPFGFRYGGIGTVPAYIYKCYGGERIAVLNLDYSLRVKFMKFLLFYDRGESLKGEHQLAHDIGAGIKISGTSLRVAHALTDSGKSWKVFVRMEKRF